MTAEVQASGSKPTYHVADVVGAQIQPAEPDQHHQHRSSAYHDRTLADAPPDAGHLSRWGCLLDATAEQSSLDDENMLAKAHFYADRFSQCNVALGVAVEVAKHRCERLALMAGIGDLLPSG